MQKWTLLTAALLACCAGGKQAEAGLFDGMDLFRSAGHHDGCCAPRPKCAAPAPKCAAPAPKPKCAAPAPKPKCAAPAPKCCAPPKPKRCAPPKCIKRRPKCVRPVPKCCGPAHDCCRPKRSFLDRLFGGHDHHGRGCRCGCGF